MRRRRVSVVFVVAMLGFLVVQLRLVALQVGQADTWRWEARRTATRFTSLPFERGWILDRNGEPLARTEEVRDLTFRFRDWRRGTAVGQAAAAAWTLDGRRRSMRTTYDGFGQLLDELLALPLEVLDPTLDPAFDADDEASAVLSPRQARRDLAWYLVKLLAREFDAALDAGLDEGEWGAARVVGDLPGAATGRVAAAARASDERRALYDLAYQSGATPHALMAGLDEAVLFIDERVERIAARQEREAVEAAAAAAAAGPLAQRDEPLHPFLRRRNLHAEFDNDTALALSPVPYDTQTLVALRADLLAGFGVHSERRRTYPPAAADHAPLILGRVGQPSPADTDVAERNRLRLADLASLEQLTPEELAEFESLRVHVREIDYTYSEQRGNLGLESALEAVLRGKRGYVAVAPGEGEQGGTDVEVERLPPRRGLNVTLTLDLRLQQAAEAVLDRALESIEVGGETKAGVPGAIVLLDPRSGQVRALATSPRPSRQDLSTRYGELARAPLGPLHQRALASGHLGNLPPPGSTFKPAVALAGLAHGVVAPGESLYCGKRIQVGTRVLSCLGTHGDIDLDEALAKSCNQYFYTLAERVGGERLLAYTDRLGFGRSTSLLRENEVLASFGIPVHSGVKEEFVALPERRLGRAETMSMGIGQAPLDDVTPLQVAVMMGAIGHGELRPPSLVASVEGFGSLPPRAPVALGVDAADLAAVRRGLEATLDRGTADHVDRHALERLGIDVAGKTGTPEVENKPDHSWFAGYLPRHDPVLAFAIFLEHTGEHGGDAGVPVFNALLDEPGLAAYLRQEVLP